MTEDREFVRRLGESGDGSGIEEAGGKAANLSRLVREGFPVPEGFFVSAGAYRLATRSVEGGIRAALEGADTAAASSSVRALVLGAGLPAAVAREIRCAYRALRDENGEPPLVAVRSSATAEDLPELSFAGQQDSYLDVRGEEALLDAVLRCWASLWNSRAIDYRGRAGLGPAAAPAAAAPAAPAPSYELPSMAVIVQSMVRAESAGVMFTADPVGGSRSRIVVEAVRGLGDALVSGLVSPERYAVVAGRDESATTGAAAGATADAVSGTAAGERILPEAELLELARLGRSVEAHFGVPQDIEWARAKSRFYLLQSRPITSLYPLPEDGRPCSWLYSFAAWQGYLAPFTPLGREAMLGIVSGAARLFGISVDTEKQRAFREAGERLWVDWGSLLGRRLGRRFVGVFLGSIDPSGGAILDAIEAEGGLAPQRKGLPLKAILGLARFFPRIMIRVMRNIAYPAIGRARLTRRIDETVRETAARLAAAGGGADLARATASLARRIAPKILPELLGGMVSSQVPYQMLLRLADRAGARAEVLELTRALPHNVTTEMDLSLWRAAERIRKDPASLASCQDLDAEGLAEAMRSGTLPEIANVALGDFINRYGFRGSGEIDLGMPRWGEDPTAIAGALLSYLSIKDEGASPEAAFRRGAERAAQAAQAIEEAMGRSKGRIAGALARKAARFLTGRVRELGGLRESPKFGIMLVLGELRSALMAEGGRLAAAGRIEEASDIFFLRTAEIARAYEDGGPPGRPGSPELRALVAERKTFRAREARRRRIPRLIAGDGRAWFDAPSLPGTGDGPSLRGSPVSPGIAEGRARIVFDPAAAGLEPGDILVCPATDPAWTPLFLAAAALVTEIGGEMTHGSVVAREYGIPAVVGVAGATDRIPEGSRIRVDGASGLVLILEAPDAE